MDAFHQAWREARLVSKSKIKSLPANTKAQRNQRVSRQTHNQKIKMIGLTCHSTSSLLFSF